MTRVLLPLIMSVCCAVEVFAAEALWRRVLNLVLALVFALVLGGTIEEKSRAKP